MKIKVVYPLMEAMQKEFTESANELEGMMSQVKKMQEQVENEGLKGLAGVALSESLEGPLQQKLKKMHLKFLELAEDIAKASEFARQADQDAASLM